MLVLAGECEVGWRQLAGECEVGWMRHYGVVKVWVWEVWLLLGHRMTFYLVVNLSHRLWS